MRRVLIVDDEELIRASLKSAAIEEGYDVFLAENGREALRLLEESCPDLVLLDLKLPDINGIDVLKKIKQVNEDVLVIIITGYASVESAVKAIKLGAYDYIKKPFKADSIKLILKLAMDRLSLDSKIQRLVRSQREEYGFENIIGESPKMKEVFLLLKKIVRYDAPTVLVRGESGTGKELIARAIHNMSKRASGPFIDIDCASMPSSLLESEMFGYEKGAFTDANRSKPGLFEESDKGTLFLDEIGDMDPVLQKKMLRVLEEKSFRRVGGLRPIHVDFRLIAATNKNLETMASNGMFREDLYYRLNVMPVVLPPLKDRENDSLLLAEHFIVRFNKAYRKKVKGISEQAQALLLNYPWPGNVRELRNVIERIMIVHETEEVLPRHLPDEILSAGDSLQVQSVLDEGMNLIEEGIDFHRLMEKSTLEITKHLISQALEKSNGNKTQAAKILGLSRSALGRQMKKIQESMEGKSTHKLVDPRIP
jgi:DNA-binding NtrC family response regulator